MHFFITTLEQFKLSAELARECLAVPVSLVEYLDFHAYELTFDNYEVVSDNWDDYNICIQVDGLQKSISEHYENEVTTDQIETLCTRYQEAFLNSKDTENIHRLELQIVKIANAYTSSQVSNFEFNALSDESDREAFEQRIDTAPTIDKWLSKQNILHDARIDVSLFQRSDYEPYDVESLYNIFQDGPIASAFSNITAEEGNNVGVGFATMYIRTNETTPVVLDGEPQLFQYRHGDHEFTVRAIKHEVGYFPILEKGNIEQVETLFDEHFGYLEPIEAPMDEYQAIRYIAEHQYIALTTISDGDSIEEIYDTYCSIYIDNTDKDVRITVSEPCNGLGVFDFIYVEKLARLHLEAIEIFKQSGLYENYTYTVDYEIEAYTVDLNDGNHTVIFHLVNDEIEGFELKVNSELNQARGNRWSPEKLASFLVSYGVFATTTTEQISGYDGDMWTNCHACYDKNQTLLFVIETVSRKGYCEEYSALMNTLNQTLGGGRHLESVNEFTITYAHDINTNTTHLKPEGFLSQTVATHLIALLQIEKPSIKSMLGIDEVDQGLINELTKHSRFEHMLLMCSPIIMPIQKYDVIGQMIEKLGIKTTNETDKIKQLSQSVQRYLGAPLDPESMFLMPVITDIPKGELTDFVVQLNMKRGGVFNERAPLESIVPATIIKDFINSMGGGTLIDLHLLQPDFIEEMPILGRP